MDRSNFYTQLCKILSKEQILCGEPMSRHTTFRVGGPADFFLQPKLEQVADVVALCQNGQMPYYVVGNGSNLLAGDVGVRGVVLSLSRPASGISVEGDVLTAQAGALLSQAAAAALNAGLGGMEFAAGIPGSVGGAVVMNAGAYGGEIKDIIRQATVLAQDGQVQRLSGTELELSYRHSCIPGRRMVVLDAQFQLQPKPQAEVRSLMEDLKQRRAEKQPLEYPSAGSTFKRPKGYFAGKLIMDAGLSGFTVGGAQVSSKHCGFVVNKGGATAADILQLIQHVQHTVQEKFGVALEMEVKCIGAFASNDGSGQPGQL